MSELGSFLPTVLVSPHERLRGRRLGEKVYLYPVFAVVAWEQDRERRLLWTKGHVAFTGP